MAQIGEAQVLAALKSITDPDRGGDIVSLGMLSGLVVRDGHVAFSIEVDPKRGAQAEPVRHAAEKAVEALPGVLSVTAVLTAHRAAPQAAAPAPKGGHGHAHGPGGQERGDADHHDIAPSYSNTVTQRQAPPPAHDGLGVAS